jgi:hypothetical protein
MLTVALVGAAATLLLAACGSKGTTTSTQSTTDWASSLCTAVTTWRSAVTSAVDSARSGTLSKSKLQDAANQVDSATQSFAETVKGLGAPDTKDGAQAKKLLDQLSGQIDAERQKVHDAVGNASSLSQLIGAAPVILGSFQTMANDVKATYKQLRALDPSGELTSAFQQASACKPLTKSS